MDCSLPGSPTMEFSRQDSWNGLPFPTPGDPPDPGIKPTSPVSSASPALTGRFFPSGTASEAPREMVKCLDFENQIPCLQNLSLIHASQIIQCSLLSLCPLFVIWE